MTNVVTPSMISAEFWALLHRMGLPKLCDSATITLAAGDVVRVTAEFALTEENGELKMVEGAIERASADYVFVREDELAVLQAAAAPFAAGGLVAPGLGVIGD